MNNQIEVLNDLVHINNDRVEGYQKAIDQLKGADSGLLSLFDDLKQQSVGYNRELSAEINQLGGEQESGTTAGGKLYRTWMDVKATFGGDDAKSILASCERGEDAAKEAYEKALDSGDLSQNARKLVMDQQNMQLQAHDKVKSLRNQYQSR